MTVQIIPYKQTLSQGCLVASFFMLHNQKYGLKAGKKEETEILMNAMDRKYSYYVIGVSKEVFNKFKKKMTIVVDNAYFANELIDGFKDSKNFNIYSEKITIATIRKLLEKGSLICHIDDNLLGDYSHVSHFIVLEKMTDKTVTILDPWHGTRGQISHKKLEDAIQSLKNHVKMCPLLFYLE